jgi:hypothetical protein
MNAWDDYERAEVDATRAPPLVRAAGDPVLELEALQLTAQIGSERGDDTGEAWLAVEDLARSSRRWENVAAAIRIRASAHLDDEPVRALPLADAAADVAAAYGLVESGGWADYTRAEANFSAGRWEEAITAGLRAIEVGEAHGYHRVVVRSWFVLLPLAHAQRREDLIRQAYSRFEERASAGRRGRRGGRSGARAGGDSGKRSVVALEGDPRPRAGRSGESASRRRGEVDRDPARNQLSPVRLMRRRKTRAQLGNAAERRRSRTYPAVGYTTSPVLKTRLIG